MSVRCWCVAGGSIFGECVCQLKPQSLYEDMLFFLLLQGLFHPARKVREVYWKIYNMLYIGSQVHIHTPCVC